MGTCTPCMRTPLVELPPGEQLMLKFEEQVPSMTGNHNDWVRQLRIQYSGDKLISFDKVRKASQVVHFDLDSLIKMMGSEKDLLLEALALGDGFAFSRILLLTIHFSSGSPESKVSTLIYSMTLEERERILVSNVRAQVEFLCDLSLLWIPQAVKRSIGSEEMISYARRLSSVKRFLLNYLMKLFCGKAAEVLIDDFKKVLVTSKEGQALVCASKLRIMAYNLYNKHSFSQESA